MKRIASSVILNIVLVLSVFPAFTDNQAQGKLDMLMDKWTTSLSSEDIDSMVSCYWPEVLDITYSTNGKSSSRVGIDAVRENQQMLFDRIDYPSLHLNYPEPARFIPESGDLPIYIYDYREKNFMDIFYFEKRSGEYRIIRHILLIMPRKQ